MKNILKLSAIVLLLLFSFQSKAQLDTLNYLKQFEYDKTEYLGKPFSKLLKKMAIKPTVFSVRQDRNNCFYISDFGFSDKNNFVFMMIVWEDCYISNPDFGMDNTNNQKFTVKEKNKRYYIL